MDIDSAANTVVVLDVETTGLSSHYGDPAIEIRAMELVVGILIDAPGQSVLFIDTLNTRD